MDFEVNQQQQEIVDRAEQLARESLAPRADRYDREGIHPKESWQDVWNAGLLVMTVPREYGGLDLDMLTYCMAMEKLAGGCTNTAMTVHMHSTVMRFISALGTPQQKSTLYPEVVSEGKLFGSWGSEPESRGGSGFRRTTITPSEGGFVIDGLKHFCTMVGGAHRYMIHGSTGDGPLQETGVLALVPHDHPNLEIMDEWDTLGMRATISPSVALKQCVVPKEAVLGKPGQAIRQGVGLAFGLGFAAVYVGAAQGALDFTTEYCRTHHFDPDPAPLAESLVIQRTVAEMTMALEGARLVLYQSACKWREEPPLQRAILSARAKYLATEAALSVTAKAIQCMGGRSVHKRFPLERIFRDIRTCTLMPPNLERTMEIVGKVELGLADSLFGTPEPE